MRPGSGTRQARHVSPAEAAAIVRSGDWVEYFTTLAQPDAFDQALAARKDALRGVRLRGCISLRPRAVIEADPTGEHFAWFSWHFSAYDRRKHDAGLAHYIPTNLSEISDHYRRFLPPPDVAVLQVRPMDGAGWFNQSGTCMWHRAIIERARTVILEVNRALPHAKGPANAVHVSEADYVIEGDHLPPPELPAPPRTEADRAVGRLIAAEIEDGACLQIGIGAMPDAVCDALLEAGTRNLGVHSEMLTDGLAALYKAGRVTGAAKALEPGRVVYSFMLGSRHLYDTVDGNADFECHPTDHTNPPHIIMRNPRVVSVNNTTQIDLQGQAASESDGHRHISGTGGQLNFVRGAYGSEGGKSFICLSSTYEKRGERRSRIVLQLTPGNIVTTPRTDIMYVVTE
jgi:acyl-CoA hydrolase